jgi:hypothetical protein
MRTLALVSLLLAFAAPALAQGGPPGPDRLREQVMQRFIENYRVQAGLTDQQFSRFQEAVRRSWDQRRNFQDRERALLQGLEAQMRPGVAANQDSVSRLLDGLVQLQANRADQSRKEQAEFAEFLNPVQRAQLVLAFARLERQIEQLLQRRMEGPGRIRNP